ncbi:hypothetical protein PACILC2_05180 [Paenibacillus cisolokensis]|uniref:Phosphoribosyltransferase domain-containing protein n=1 Tax=Paenibacillus cisolokensis TaxID=1658519 RepID=A0ABQ4N1A6_9BACL|nr:hypothetical protein PACILC2_05180 [Paenibacillus cisolokensis]
MSQLVICDHPLIQHKLTYIRDKNTNTKDFRELVDEVATLMAYEITRSIPLEKLRYPRRYATRNPMSFPVGCSGSFRFCGRGSVWSTAC